MFGGGFIQSLYILYIYYIFTIYASKNREISTLDILMQLDIIYRESTGAMQSEKFMCKAVFLSLLQIQKCK